MLLRISQGTIPKHSLTSITAMDHFISGQQTTYIRGDVLFVKFLGSL